MRYKCYAPQELYLKRYCFAPVSVSVPRQDVIILVSSWFSNESLIKRCIKPS